MKSLYESIIGSNNAGVKGEIKAILTAIPCRSGADELNKIWDKLGLGIDSCIWSVSNLGSGQMHYTFESPSKMLIIINQKLPGGKIADVISCESNFDFYLTVNKKVDYKTWIDNVKKKLNAKINEIKNNKDWLEIKF